MPMYSAVCGNPECPVKKFSFFAKIEERNRDVRCGTCSCLAQRVLDAPRIAPDYEPYECPITGIEIRGRRAHEENLAKHGCRVYEAGELEDHKRERAAQELAYEERLADAAANAALSLPAEKFEILAGEMIHGAEAPMERT